MLGVHRGERLERRDALVLGLADADEDPARERDLQLAGGADRLQAARRVLGRRALVGDEVGVDRLEHQPLRGGDLAQPREVLARRARRGSCAAAARARARARRPRRRRRRSPRGRARRAAPDARVDLGRSPVRTSSSLTWRLAAPSSSAVTSSGACRCGLVRRERAVLAVAAARPRQRERQVAREGDAPAHRPKSSPRPTRSYPRADARPHHARRARDRPRARARRLRLRSRSRPTQQAATLLLDFTPNAVHTGIYTASSRGYDTGEGVKLSIVAPSALDRRGQAAGRRPGRLRDPRHPRPRARPRAAARDLVGVMAIVQRPLAAVLAQPGDADAARPRGPARRRHRAAERRRGPALDRHGRRRRPATRSSRRRSASTPSAPCSAGQRRRGDGVLERRGRRAAAQAAGHPRVPGRRLRRAGLPRARPLHDRAHAAGAQERRGRPRPALTRGYGQVLQDPETASQSSWRAPRPRPGRDPGRARRRLPRLRGARRQDRRARPPPARGLGDVGRQVRDRQAARPTWPSSSGVERSTGLLREQAAALAAHRLGPAPLGLDRGAADAHLAHGELAGDPGLVEQLQRAVDGRRRGRVAERWATSRRQCQSWFEYGWALTVTT